MLVFAAGALAFAVTSAIIVTAGHFLISFVPISWITLAGGTIMIGYAVWSFMTTEEESEIERVERRLSATASKGNASVFLSAVGLLMILDLGGDATEVLTILFVARFQDAILVFIAAVIALVAATAVETAIGNRLSRILSTNRIRVFSVAVFLIIGTAAILSVLLHV